LTSDSDRRLLLQLARDAIAAQVHRLPAPAPELAGVLAQPGGAFVSIHRHGDLRGCIGHIEANEPLGQVVVRCAVAACSRDPRFPSVTAEELADLDLELSLLGPLEPIAGADDVEIGTHGLVVEQGWRRGLLLPQVATEWKWDREAFLAHTCHKAGLPVDAWKKGAKMWRFQAEVFGEETLHHGGHGGTEL
jgi:AmmeMemoRadiSam system protein A